MDIGKRICALLSTSSAQLEFLPGSFLCSVGQLKIQRPRCEVSWRWSRTGEECDFLDACPNFFRGVNILWQLHCMQFL